MTATTTDLSRPRFARMYLRSSKNAEARGATEHRRRLLDGLHGTVLELGAGHGLNFPHYPAGERSHRDRARTNIARPRCRDCSERDGARTRAGRRRRRAAGRGPERRRSRREPRPLLGPRPAPRTRRAAPRPAPGGELRFYEHVIPRCQPKRLLLQAADHSGLWPTIAGGCHPARDTATAIEHAGFQIQSSERIMFAASALEPTIPYILGVARRA